MKKIYPLHQTKEENTVSSVEKELLRISREGLKSATEPASNLYNTINNVMTKRSKYKTVSSAVEDMQKRSGFKDFQLKHSSEEKFSKSGEPEVFSLNKNIKQTIDNCIKDNNGTLSIPIIIERVYNIYKNEVGEDKYWNDPKLLKYIQLENLKFKIVEEYNPRLGLNNTDTQEEANPANQDIFYNLLPKT